MVAAIAIAGMATACSHGYGPRHTETLTTSEYPYVTIERPHFDDVAVARYVNRGNAIITGGYDGELKVWEISKAMPFIRGEKTVGGIVDVLEVYTNNRTSEDIIIAAGGERLLLWNVKNDSVTRISQPVDDIAFDPEGHMLAILNDYRIQMWDIENGSMRDRVFRGLDHVMVLGDGKSLLTIGHHRSMFWDIETGRPQKSPWPDDTWLAADEKTMSHSRGSSTTVWDVEEPNSPLGIEHDRCADFVQFTIHHRNRVAGLQRDGKVSIWDLSKGTNSASVYDTGVSMSNRNIDDFSFDESGKKLRVSGDHLFLQLDVSQPDDTRTEFYSTGLSNAIVSPYNRYLATFAGPQMAIWTLENEIRSPVMLGQPSHGGYGQDVEYDSSGGRLVTVTRRDGVVSGKVWDANSATLIKAFDIALDGEQGNTKIGFVGSDPVLITDRTSLWDMMRARVGDGPTLILSARGWRLGVGGTEEARVSANDGQDEGVGPNEGYAASMLQRVIMEGVNDADTDGALDIGDERICVSNEGVSKCFFVDQPTSAAMSPDGRYVAIGNRIGKAEVFDWESGAPVATLYGYGSIKVKFRPLVGDPNKYELATAGDIVSLHKTDGWASTMSIHLSAHRMVRERGEETEYLIVDRKGYFIASDVEVKERLRYRTEGSHVLLSGTMGADERGASVFEDADLVSRYQKLASKQGRQRSSGAKPEIEIMRFRHVELSVEVVVRAIPAQEDQILDISLWREGRGIRGEDDLENVVGESGIGEREKTFFVPLIPGSENRIEIEVKTRKMMSATVKRTVKVEGTRPKGTLHVLLVGPTDYLPVMGNETGTNLDLKKMNDVFGKEPLSIFEKVKIETLSHNVDAEKVVEGLDALATNPEDTLILYFSGHGDQEVCGPKAGEDFYYAMSLSTRDNLCETGLSLMELTRALQRVKAARLLLIADVCFGDKLTQEKFFDDVREGKGWQLEDVYENSIKDTGMAVIAGMGPVFGSENTGGVLTNIIHLALTAPDGERPGNGQVTVEWLMDAVRRGVESMRAPGCKRGRTECDSVGRYAVKGVGDNFLVYHNPKWVHEPAGAADAAEAAEFGQAVRAFINSRRNEMLRCTGNAPINVMWMADMQGKVRFSVEALDAETPEGRCVIGSLEGTNTMWAVPGISGQFSVVATVQDPAARRGRRMCQ